MTEERIAELAKLVYSELGRFDALFVASVARRYPDRLATMMNVYIGQLFDEREFACLVLRICRQIDAGGAA